MSQPPVLLPRALRQRLVDRAREAHPRECCGLLVGRGRRVDYAVAMPNVDRRPARFRVSDAAHIELRRLLRTFMPPLQIVGVYHSHPAGPRAALRDGSPRSALSRLGARRHRFVCRRAEIRAFVVRDQSGVPVPIRWRASASSRWGGG